MNGKGVPMAVDIVEYKKTILEMFHSLTEMEIKASIDAAGEIPEYKSMANCYNLAVVRCREILEIILNGAG